MLRRAVLSLALITACLGFAGSAQALYMEGGQSTEGIGAFYGYIWYLPASETEAELWVVLTNASDRANGGCITGFVLNNPGNRITSVARGEDFPAAFNILGAANPYDGIKASPFGRFDLGACLGNELPRRRQPHRRHPGRGRRGHHDLPLPAQRHRPGPALRLGLRHDPLRPDRARTSSRASSSSASRAATTTARTSWLPSSPGSSISRGREERRLRRAGALPLHPARGMIPLDPAV